jgi:hypothetical protein
MRHKWKVSIPSFHGSYEEDLTFSSSWKAQLEARVGRKNVTTFRLLWKCWVAMLGDSPLGYKPNRVIRKFSIELQDDPVGCIAKLSELAHRLETSLEVIDGEVVFIDNLFGEFKRTPVFREFHQFTKSHDPAILRYLLSFCYFGKKIAYDDPSLDATALRKWIEVEQGLNDLVIDDAADVLRLVVEHIVKDWSDFAFLPKHGSGSVAERSVWSTQRKCEAMTISPSLEYMFLREKVGQPLTKLDTVDEFGNSCNWLPTPTGSLPPIELTPFSSRLKFVPKTWKTSRSICMEPVGYQWAQQGVRTWFEREMSETILKNFVVLKDQGVNQEAAMLGSLTQRIDTIDLSSASDSVAWALVKRAFPPKILKYLRATRSPLIELPDGTLHSPAKFSPMGSAVCFPVQSLLYSAIVAMCYISVETGVSWKDVDAFRKLDLDFLWKFILGDGRYSKRFNIYPFRIYGDDITCDNKVTSNVVGALQHFGFSVNTEKSFTGAKAYRESCGKYYFRGHDVSFIRFKTKRLNPRLSIEQVAGLVDFSNLAYDYGYLHLRRHIISYVLHTPILGVRSVGRNPLLFVSSDDRDTSLAIRCDNPRNEHLTKKYFSLNEEEGNNFQASEIRRSLQTKGKRRKVPYNGYSNHQTSLVHSISLGPKGKSKLSMDYDSYRYTLWWRSRHWSESELRTSPLRRKEDLRIFAQAHTESQPIPTSEPIRTGPKWRWTPLS